ncbi:hemerythrin domain-containing protein [Actinotalea ferrariae]|uniref:hemerythrin domain-containing protein n=1 Tax=Actinotalea ferrariae TaxID=1386098 RepID=UPI001C8B6FE4|nr:hemerythrin domain-containing protein [Actinotalea ferrariae]MBX9243500.1 hemerythrin domain-containing protein [Actinotalea ferrariae]
MVRSIAGQSIAELGGRWSVLVRQRSDHVTLDRLLHELDGAGPEHEQDVLRRLYRLVFPHAFAEESVLWPLMRRALADGEALTLQVEREHQEVNELVTRLEATAPDDAARAPLLERLAEVLREDVRDEEDELFPRLQAVTDQRELRRLGVLWELVRRIAPTRAHPVVARRPPGNVVSALPLSVVDRLRDLADLGATRGPARTRPALRAVSRGLGRLAHAIERIPLLRIGEDRSTSRAWAAGATVRPAG